MKLIILSLLFISGLLESDALEFQSRALIELSDSYDPSIEDLKRILDEPKFLKEVLQSATVDPKTLSRELQQLRGQISVQREETTENVMIVLSVRAKGKRETQRLATRVANVFSGYISRGEIAQAEKELKELDRELRRQEEIVKKKRETLDSLMKEIKLRAEGEKEGKGVE